MIHAKGVVFGDGITEITPLPQCPEIKVFDINRRTIGMDIDVPQENVHKTQYLHKRTWFDRRWDYILVFTVLFPMVFGMVFANVMVRNELFYCGYWFVTMSWTAIFGFLCGRSKRRPHRPLSKATRSRSR